MCLVSSCCFFACFSLLVCACSRLQEVLVAGRRRPVTFYRLCLGARGLGAPWPGPDAWVHDCPLVGGGAASKEPLAAYLADKPALLTLSEVKRAQLALRL